MNWEGDNVEESKLWMLLRQTRENFSIDHDAESLRKCEAGVKEIIQRLMEQREQFELKLNGDKTRVGALEKGIESERTRKARFEQHLDRLTRSGEFVSLAKELEELEAEINHMREELKSGMEELLDEEQQQVQRQQLTEEADGAEPQRRTDVLKLRLYRSLGVVLDIENNQVLIGSNDGSTLDVLSIDDSVISSYFRTKYIWDRICKGGSND